VVFRDSLYLTNGVDRPREITFRRFSHPEGAFVVRNMGLVAPYTPAAAIAVYARAGWDDFAPGEYQLWISFLDDLGRESEPTLFHVFEMATAWAGMRLTRLPRSPDPNVVARKIYLSPTGGGTPLEWRTLPDNDSYDAQAFGQHLGGALAVLLGERLPAPRARRITTGGGTGTIVLLHLTEEAAGGNAFAWSGEEVTYFPLEQRVVVDSRDGKPLLAGLAHLGRFYLFKRDSTWEFGSQGLSNPLEGRVYLRPINESVGMPGGLTVQDNVVFGVGDRGVERFDGANHVYASQSLYEDLLEMDTSDDALLRCFGAYERRDGQYWLSMPRPGERFNTRVFVLHSMAGLGDGQVWVRFELPRHSYMAAMLDPVTEETGIVIGTASGALLRYDRTMLIDGTDDRLAAGVAPVLEGLASSGTTTSLTIASGAFTALRLGLRGCRIMVNGEERIIESNSATTVRWRDPLPQTVSAGDEFVIGAFEAYYTTGWLAPQRMGSGVMVKWVDFEFAPSPASLLVEVQVTKANVATERAWPSAGAELHAVPMAQGYLSQPLPVRLNNRGRYARLRFGTDAIRDPFAVSALQVRFDESGLRGEAKG
jgi:hypothetical protein